MHDALNSPRLERLSTCPSVYFVDTWYESAQGNHFWMSGRYRFLLDAFNRARLPKKAPLHGLDVGGGAGIFRDQIENSTAWTLDCADLDERALAMAKSARGRNLFYDIASPHPDLLGKYDLIFLMDVLEHIEFPIPFLSAAVKHLKPGGLVIINVPALPALYSEYDRCAGHFRRYSATSLREELAGFPLREVQMGYWGFTLVPLLFIRKLIMGRKMSRDQVIRAGFEPPLALFNSLLKLDLEIERRLIPWRPLGTSLIYIGRLDAQSS